MESLKSDKAVNTTDNLQNFNSKAIAGDGACGYKISVCHDTEKKLPFSDIVVVGNVYGHGDCRETSGFGDVAHAARAVRVLCSEFRGRSLKLIVEGKYDESCQENNDYEIFKRITSIPDVETILVNNHKTCLNKNETNQEVKKHLSNAKVIVHGPANTISVIRDNPSDFSGKTIYFDEYNSGSLHAREKYPGIEYLSSGFPCNRRTGGMFLKEPDINQTEFEDVFFQDHIKLTDKTFFYFCYHNKEMSLESSIILFSMLGCPSGQDITIVSSSSEEYAQELYKAMDDIWISISFNSDNPVKKIRLISRMGMKQEWVNTCSPENSIGRTVTILIPNGFSPNDAFLLGKYAKCTVSSGDLSMSDVLAAGRIPIAALDGKEDNARVMHQHLENFSKQYPQYQQQVKCMGLLMVAMGNVYCERLVSSMARDFKIVGTQEWSEFEQSYIDYLRLHPGIFLENNLCHAVRRRLETETQPVIEKHSSQC